MAYESKLIIVEKSSIKGIEESVKDFFMCEKIAEINLCCIDGEILERIYNNPDSDCFIWYEGTPTATDCYGQRFKEMTLKKAIKIFSYAVSISDYRRYEPCLSLLKGFNTQDWNDLVVLYFGY